MGRVIFDTATTMNGFIADTGHSLAWLFAVDGGAEPAEDLLPPNASVLVMGSSTYAWLVREELMLDHPERWDAFALGRPVFVFSSREHAVPRGAEPTFVSGPVADHFGPIERAAAGGDVWVIGGGDLAGQFFDAGHLDIVALSVAPVTLDGGAPLLPRRIESDRLRLTSATQVGQFARLIYEVRSPA